MSDSNVLESLLRHPDLITDAHINKMVTNPDASVGIAAVKTDRVSPENLMVAMNHSGKDYDKSTKLRHQAISKFYTNPKVTPEHLDSLSSHPLMPIRNMVAKHHSTSARTLHKLADDAYPEVKLSVMGNRNIHTGTLDHLSNHPEEWVRGEVAMTNHTPFATVEKLSNDPHPMVRNASTHSKNISDESLKRLSKDSDNSVAVAAESAITKRKFNGQ